MVRFFRIDLPCAAAALLAAGLVAASLVGCAADTQPPSDVPPQEQSMTDGNNDQDKEQNQSVSEKNSDLTFEDIPDENVIDIVELERLISEGADMEIVDIRPTRTFATGYIDGAHNIPAGRQIEIRLDEILKGKTVVLIAQNNDRLAETRQTLIDYGYDQQLIKVVDGGMLAWAKADLPVKTKEPLGC